MTRRIEHTQGPWKHESTWSGLIAIKGPTGRLIATLEKHGTLKQGVAATAHAEEQEANARLIAAGPEMLAAIRWLLDDMHDAGETFSPGGVMYDTVRAAVDAVRTVVPEDDQPDWWKL